MLRHVTVVAIVVGKDKRILLVRRAPHLSRGGKLTIPGGFMDRGENTRETVTREILEETGLRATELTLFRINDNPNRPKEDRQNVDFIYVGHVNEGETKINSEVSEFVWVDENSLPAEEEFAFDHRETILKYFEHLKHPLQIPIIG